MKILIKQLAIWKRSFLRLLEPEFRPHPTQDWTRRVDPDPEPIADESECRYFDGHGVPGKVIGGICPVCGAAARFSGFNENLRESGVCSRCGSTNRNRQMASMIRRRFGLPFDGSLTLPKLWKIYNAEAAGPLHEKLKPHPGYICSEYWGPEYRPGEVVQGIRHEDLQRLSFASGSFDLVVSSDILEHMPDPYRAHQEVFRVLKPGGVHIFTVPFQVNVEDDEIRARLVNGEPIYLKEKVFHVDPLRPGEGVLVWTVFGMEMLRKLREIGFQATMWIMHEANHGIIGRNNSVFEAKKP